MTVRGSASFGPRTPLVQLGPKESKDQMSQKTKGVRGPNEDRDQTNIWTKWNSESKSVWDQRKIVYQMMIKDQRSKMGPMCPGTKWILGPKESSWSKVSRDQRNLGPNESWDQRIPMGSVCPRTKCISDQMNQKSQMRSVWSKTKCISDHKFGHNEPSVSWDQMKPRLYVLPWLDDSWRESYFAPSHRLVSNVIANYDWTIWHRFFRRKFFCRQQFFRWKFFSSKILLLVFRPKKFSTKKIGAGMVDTSCVFGSRRTWRNCELIGSSKCLTQSLKNVSVFCQN